MPLWGQSLTSSVQHFLLCSHFNQALPTNAGIRYAWSPIAGLAKTTIRDALAATEHFGHNPRYQAHKWRGQMVQAAFAQAPGYRREHLAVGERFIVYDIINAR
jgi:hypothetical protein